MNMSALGQYSKAMQVTNDDILLDSLMSENDVIDKINLTNDSHDTDRGLTVDKAIMIVPGTKNKTLKNSNKYIDKVKTNFLIVENNA